MNGFYWDIGLKLVNWNLIYLTISDAYDFQHSVACLKILMFGSFSCSSFFDFLVVNFIISKNLKILKISDNNRPKICKASTSEDIKNENLPEIL